MLSLDEIEQGAQCTHKNTGLRYSVVEVGEDEVLLGSRPKLRTCRIWSFPPSCS
jgi:hypothetical protein